MKQLRAALIFAMLLGLTAFARAEGTDRLLDEIDNTPPATRPTDTASPVARADQSFASLVAFFAPTLAVTAAVGVCGSVVGTFVLRRGEAMLALALPQAVAVGAAVGMRLGWPQLPPAFVTVGLALLLFASEQRRTAGRPARPSLVPAIYIAGLCLSFLIVAHGGQHVEDLQNLFTGIDVAVTPAEAWTIAPLLLLVGGLLALLWRRWLLMAQLPASAELAGVSVGRWHGGFLAGLAVYVLLGTATQGVVMVLAMLFLPATVAGGICRRIPSALATAAAAALLMTIGGFACSYAFSWPLSHSVGGVGFGLLLLAQAIGPRFR